MMMVGWGSKDYVSDKDRFCMYKITVGEKVNLLEIIFSYWLQAFKDRFNPKVKKNHIPFRIFYTKIVRNASVDVSLLEPSSRATQLKGVTFVKMGIAESFPNYVKKHISKKVKKESKEEPQSVVGSQDQSTNLESRASSQ